MQSPLHQVSDRAINRCHAYSTMTRAVGVWNSILLFNPQFMICTYQEFVMSRIEFMISWNEFTISALAVPDCIHRECLPRAV